MQSIRQRRVLPTIGWLISLCGHLALALVLAFWLRPIPQTEQVPGTLHVLWSEPESVETGLSWFVAPSTAEFDNADPPGAYLAHLPTSDAEFEVSLLGANQALSGRAARTAHNAQGKVAPTSAGAKLLQAEFFGTVARGDRFVYVVDMSGSMDGSIDRQGTRFDRARQELIRSIEQLHERQGFCVLLFSAVTRPMFDDELYARQFLPSSRENKDRLQAWLRQVKPEGGTDPRDALRLSLLLRPNAVFLLSDGEFSRYQRVAEFVFGELGKAETADKAPLQTRVPIHTFAYEDLSGAKSMQELAKLSGGTYRFVEASAEASASRQRELASVAERDAAQQLGLGKGHEKIGRVERALTHYRQIIARYPGTRAAREAAAGVERLAPSE